eukprot:752470-Pleurochrysis_carterae.AAC.1
MPWFAPASCAPLSVTDDGCKVTNLASGALQIAMVSPVRDHANTSTASPAAHSRCSLAVRTPSELEAVAITCVASPT